MDHDSKERTAKARKPRQGIQDRTIVTEQPAQKSRN
jgi:hypothetical protein